MPRRNDPFTPEWGPLWDYLQNKELRQCPSFTVDPTAQGQFEMGTGGYGYNAQYVGGSPGQYADGSMYIPASMNQINDLSQTVMLTDTATFNCEGKYIEYSFCEAPTYEAWGGMLACPSTHFRHGGFANVAFCDGHAKAMKMVYTQTTGSCPWGGTTLYTKEDYRKANMGFLSADNSLYDRN